MSKFKIVTTYRSGIIRYNSPIFYVEAQTQEQAIEAGKHKSGLSKFKEWSFQAFQIKDKESINNKNKKQWHTN